MNRVMIYDEGGTIQELFHGVMEFKDYDVFCPQDLDEACAIVRNGWVDVIVVELPDSPDGQAVGKALLRIGRIKEVAGRIPIILVSDRPGLGELEVKEVGFAGLLHQPFTFEDLEVKLEAVVRQPELTGASLAA